MAQSTLTRAAARILLAPALPVWHVLPRVIGLLRYGVTQSQALSKVVRLGYRWPYHDYRTRIAVQRFVQDIPLKQRHPTAALLDRIDASLEKHRDKPILICWGMRDFCFTEHYLQGWIQRYREARVQRFDNAGHLLFEDECTEVIATVQRFLSETGP